MEKVEEEEEEDGEEGGGGGEFVQGSVGRGLGWGEDAAETTR